MSEMSLDIKSFVFLLSALAFAMAAGSTCGYKT